MSDTGLDIFEGVTDSPIESTDTSPVESAGAEGTVVTEDGGVVQDTPDVPVETVAVIPDGAMSVTEFAAYMTQTLMKAKFEAGQDLGPDDYVVPQAVYQTVKAQRDRIPHVLVKGEDDTEARVYILRDEATAWWTDRKERLSTRGSGAARASSRSAEDNLTLLGAAVGKHLYAEARLAMWTERVAQADKLVDKYKGFLKEQNADLDIVTLTIQEATDAFHAEQAAKAAEKALKDKKAGKTESDTNDDNE